MATMRAFDHAAPTSAVDALSLLTADGEAAALRPLRGTQPLAGGTDLLTLMKADVAAPDHLVTLKRIPELAADIQDTPDGVVIGALTTLAQLEKSPLIQQRYQALAEAAALAATPQLRNMATIGGNLLQRSRCWYFRNPRFHCWLKGGDACHARDGDNRFHALFGFDGAGEPRPADAQGAAGTAAEGRDAPDAPAGDAQAQGDSAGRPGASPCVSVHPSDPPNALVALDAEIRVRGSAGERTLPAARFFALPEPNRRSEAVIRPGELIVSIRLPRPPDGARSTYLKAMDRKVWAFALVGVAAALRLDQGRITDARLVLGGVAPIPWRAVEAERVLDGQAPDDALFTRAAEVALASARPLTQNAYKVPLARNLIRRALAALTA